MNRTTLIVSMIFGMIACAPQPGTVNTPLAPTQPATVILTPTLVLPTLALFTSTAAPPTQPPPAPTNTVAPPVVFTVTLPPLDIAVFNPYAVILVNPGDVLNIRAGAGVGNDIVGTLQPKAVGVIRTGPAVSVDGDRWVEIQNPKGGTGWVNANFLTEKVASSTFCADARVPALLSNLKTALLTANGDLLASLVSPVHGLELRFWRYGAAANYSQAEAAWVFQSDYEVSWGPAPGSGEETRGTFSAQPLPRLQEVFGANYSLHCNDPLDLATFSLEPVPPEHANINFYTVFKPGSDQYGGLDWRAWIAGIEYVQGKPALFSLIHFQWEP
jgi:hypothetical protein